MGFVLTLLYIALTLLSPVNLLPSLAEYRISLVVILIALVFSLPSALDSRLFRVPQIYLLSGLFGFVFLSVAAGPTHWFGGGFLVVEQFLSLSIAFYLVVLNCQSIKRLQMLAACLLVIAVFYVVEGARAYYQAEALAEEGKVSPTCVLKETGKGDNAAALKMCNINYHLLKVIPTSDGSYTFRMQGQGLVYDPNDLAQFLVMLIPFIWVWWRPWRRAHNAVIVWAPTILLVWGIYLTHSRSGLIALVTILTLAIMERVNWTLALSGGALAMGAFLGLGFTGGRDISIESGSDRLYIWSNGLELFKSSPIVGIGFHQFRGGAGHTAHNSFLICLAELGFLAFILWLGLIVFTVFDLNSLIGWLRQRKRGESFADHKSSAYELVEESRVANDDLERWARALRLSLAGFLVAAWFLSRAYMLTLYVLLGMAVTLVWMVKNEGRQLRRKSMFHMSAVTVFLGVAIVGAIYAFVRVGHYILGSS